MRRLALAGALLGCLVAAAPAWGQNVTEFCSGTNAPLRPIAGYQQLTVSTAAVALTVPSGALVAVVVLEATNGLRYRDDGTNPTAAIGMPVAGGGTVTFCATSLAPVRLIRSGAADAIANVAYYGR